VFDKSELRVQRFVGPMAVAGKGPTIVAVKGAPTPGSTSDEP
jgi:hypothetical protein